MSTKAKSIKANRLAAPLKKMKLRGADPTGAGWFGAKRGRRRHKGLDLVASPGTEVMSPISGEVTKLGFAYRDNYDIRYVEVTGEMYRVRLFYVQPSVTVGDRIFTGDRVGYAQDIASHWNSAMINHIHLEVYKYTLLTDPEPLVF